jgi:hypothetical protein
MLMRLLLLQTRQARTGVSRRHRPSTTVGRCNEGG